MIIFSRKEKDKKNDKDDCVRESHGEKKKETK